MRTISLESFLTVDENFGSSANFSESNFRWNSFIVRNEHCKVRIRGGPSLAPVN